MQMVTWEAIFPTPILRTNIGRPLTAGEQAFIDTARQGTVESPGNSRSADTQVLDAPELGAIRAFVAGQVTAFAEKAISTERNLEFYITQSWLNYTRPGEHHHRHIHTNSLVSGVFYVSARKESDRLWFFRSSAAQIKISQGQTNWYNADAWFFSVGTGDLVLFPSHIPHEVAKLEGDETRVSLAFNAFVRGEIGAADSLNLLRL